MADAQEVAGQAVAWDALEDSTYELAVQLRDQLASALWEEHGEEEAHLVARWTA